jgi:hypothetical protein
MPELTEEQKRILESVKGARQNTGWASLTPQQAAILEQARAKTLPAGYQNMGAGDRALLSIPGAGAALEFGNAVARGVTGPVDFVTEGANYALRPTGVQIPSLQAGLESVGAMRPKGTYMEPSLTRDIITTAGEVIPATVGGQGLLREGLRRAPAAIPNAAAPSMVSPRVQEFKDTGRRVLESISFTTPRQEAIAATGAVIGQEIGEETGIPGAGVVGALVGGAGSLPVISGIDRVFTNRNDLAATAQNLSRLNTDIASEILARSLRDSGMSPREAMQAYRNLGSDAMPADINDSFREIMRAAMNIDEGVAGTARRTLTERQRGAGARIAGSLDLIGAGSVDDYISQIDKTLKPRISELYAAAAASPLPLSGRLRFLMQGDNSLGRAMQVAESRLADRRAVGDQISHFDIVDETKRVMDDQIGSALRDGRRNEARNLIRLKNEMVREADNAIPEYGQARQLYAGRAALDDAAKIGSEFFNTPQRELYDLTSTMTAPEKSAYALSAKDAILNRIDGTGMNRDQVSALFGKNGDAQKLRTLFDTEAAFNSFVNGLKRETEFMMTRRAAMGNSTTAAQLARMQGALNPPGGFRQALNGAVNILSGNPAAIGRETAGVIDGLNATKGSEEYVNGLIKAGDILITAGMNPARVEQLIRQGSVNRLTVELQRIAEPNYSRRSAGLVGTSAAGLADDTEE